MSSLKTSITPFNAAVHPLRQFPEGVTDAADENL